MAAHAFAALSLDRFDIAIVPFPFTDRTSSKRRPALVLSSAAFNQPAQHAVMAMVTSTEQFAWPGDCPIQDLNAAGLTMPCLVRLKLFTLDARLVIRKAGALALEDQRKLQRAWRGLLAI